MKLYLANGRYVGTQIDAKKFDKNFRPVEVPTDKQGLIDYLNGLVDKPAAVAFDAFGNVSGNTLGVSAAVSRPAVDLSDPAVQPTGKYDTIERLDRLSSVAAFDAPNLTQVEDFIQAADHVQLSRVTDNAIHRMRELLAQAKPIAVDELMG